MSLWSRFARTFRSGRHAEEIEEELAYHLAMKERDGFDPRAAKVRLGNRTRLKEDMRAEGTWVWLESLLRDIRYGLRQLRRTPLLTLVIVLSLALGIGANTAIFSLVDAALLKPLPVKDPQSLRLIEWSTTQGWPEALCHSLTGDTSGSPYSVMRGSSIAPGIYRQLAKEQHGFGALIGFSDPGPVVVASGGEPAKQFQLEYVSANFFHALGRSPQLGRAFSIADDRAGQPPLVVISDRLWHKRFAGREDVLGQTLRVNNVPVQIIGIAPAGFFGMQIGEWVDLYAPLSALVTLSPRAKLDESFGGADTYWWVRQVGRLKPGVSETQAIQQLSVLFQRMVVPEGTTIPAGKVPKLVAGPGARLRPDWNGQSSRPLDFAASSRIDSVDCLR